MTGKHNENLDTFQRLARYLNALPAGYPPTPSGVEIDLLKKLFSEPEAALALHLRLINEPPGIIARRAGLAVDRVKSLLEGMANKGLIAVHYEADGSAHYAVSQFVIGFWEGQVNRLDQETVELFESYGPTWFEKGAWKTLPQVRTIPINEAIPVTTEVMAYEKAESILRSKSLIAVQNCICRQEQGLLDQGCGKPLETCLSFDNAATSGITLGRARQISLNEAIDILAQAREAGLVLQPANSKNPIFMCACCDCCCGVLRQIKKEPNPAGLVMNPFIAAYDKTLCIECGACVEICPMDALCESPAGKINFNPDRCIGCGLCTSRCPADALTIIKKSKKDRPRIPGNTTSTYLRLAAKRGLGNLVVNGWLLVRAWLDNQLNKE